MRPANSRGSGALAQKEVPRDLTVHCQGRAPGCAPELDDGRPCYVHKLLDRHEDRHDERKSHCNRHSGGHDDDVEGEVVPLLLPKVDLHILSQHVHLDDEGEEEDGHQGETKGLGDRVVDIALEG